MSRGQGGSSMVITKLHNYEPVWRGAQEWCWGHGVSLYGEGTGGQGFLYGEGKAGGLLFCGKTGPEPCMGTPSPNRQTDRHDCKHYLPQLYPRAVTNTQF